MTRRHVQAVCATGWRRQHQSPVPVCGNHDPAMEHLLPECAVWPPVQTRLKVQNPHINGRPDRFSGQFSVNSCFDSCQHRDILVWPNQEIFCHVVQ